MVRRAGGARLRLRDAQEARGREAPGGDRRQEGGGGGGRQRGRRSVRAQGGAPGVRGGGQGAAAGENRRSRGRQGEEEVAQRRRAERRDAGGTAPPPAGRATSRRWMPNPAGISRTQRTGAADADGVSSDDDDAEETRDGVFVDAGAHASAFPATPPPPPPPPPMRAGTSRRRLRGRRPARRTTRLKPPAGRLGSALNLRELDVLGRSEVQEASTRRHNFAMPPDWSPGTGGALPPRFPSGTGDRRRG